MSLDNVLEILSERGLSIIVSPEGKPSIKGKKEEVTDAVKEALSVYRDEIIERFRPKLERRIVLVAENGEVEEVLEECSKEGVHERTRNHADRHPGRIVAAEWLGPLGWVRWLTLDRRSVFANGEASTSAGRPEGDCVSDAAPSLPANGNREGIITPDSAS